MSALKFSGVGTDPEIITYKTSLILKCFDSAEILHFATQVPHNYKEGSDMSVHVHWTPHSRGTAESGNSVAWKVECVVAKIDGTFGSTATADCTDICDGINDAHQISPGVSVSGTGVGISSMIIGRVYRDAGDTWTTNTAGSRPALLEVDFHYEIDSLGSVQERSKD
jgi:hypothetical protein